MTNTHPGNAPDGGRTTHPAAEPFALGEVPLRNRLVATAHGLATVAEGVPTEQDAAYWRRLAAGGPALVVAGGTQVSPDSMPRNRILTEAYDPRAVPGLRERAAAMRDEGAVAGIQLGHLGRETLGAGTFLPFVAPGPTPGPREPAPARTLGTDEVARIVADYRDSTKHCVEAGFDVIEIHAAHGYLLAQFLSRAANTRTDRYGGSVVNRARALAEVVAGVRAGVAAAGGRAAVGVRVSVEGDGPDHLRLDDLAELMPVVLEHAPPDYVNLTWGDRGRYVPDMAITKPPLLHRSAELRAELDVPLVLCAAFRSPDDVAQALTSGAADLVGQARAHIADPDHARKLLDGRTEEIRPCVACLQDCRSYNPTGLCTVNPDLAPAGETRRPAEPLRLAPPAPQRAEAQRATVVVVGAGPAGLECALTAARRPGIDVVLLERENDIGGQLRLAAHAPHRDGWADLIGYYRKNLHRLGVEMRLACDVTVDTEAMALVEDADEIVWALGAAESPPTIPGAVTSTELLTDPDGLLSGRRSVLVADDGFGGWLGISPVETGLAAGLPALLSTPGPGAAGGIPAEARTQLFERLRGAAFDLRPLRTVESAADGSVSLRHSLTGVAEPGVADPEMDLIVQVGIRGQRAVPPISTGAGVRAIGDCVAPREVSHAIAEGRVAGIHAAAEREQVGSGGRS